MKRKIISLLLTTALALTALTGCGQTGSIAETAAQEEEKTNTDDR